MSVGEEVAQIDGTELKLSPGVGDGKRYNVTRG